MTTFDPIFVPAEVREAVTAAAWLAAMLDAERALANVSSLVGVIPTAAAAAIAERCEPDLYDLDALLAEGRLSGNPAEPLVRALRERVDEDARRWVHFGATSQDIIDTAAMLVARTATDLTCDELDGAAAAAASHAETHRATPMAARTLLQQAVPTTFGAKAAGWLAAISAALERLRGVRWYAQLGGAAGTLAPFGDRGPEILEAFAAELELLAPDVPWHTERGSMADLAGALDSAAQSCAKIALDVVLLAQTEVGEVTERDGGASSTMPHKHNPTRAVLARACARLVHANAGLLTSGGDYELERAAGAWQAEWTALSESLAHSGGAAAATRECLEQLEISPQRMRENMRPEIYSERDRLGLDDPDYLGASAAFVDRALARWRGGV